MISTGPILDKITLTKPKSHLIAGNYPFNVPVIKNLKSFIFKNRITFLVGENGTGKSTLLESIAIKSGFGSEGGNKNISFQTGLKEKYTDSELLAQHLTLSWRQKPKYGYFFRAETFFNIANHLEAMSHQYGTGPAEVFAPYGGKSLHDQSHGESFLSFFKNQVKQEGFFILDEPEAALSPQRQLSLMVIINEALKQPNTQLLIATHSPILLGFPNADIYSLDGDKLEKIELEQTSHYLITKGFLDNPTSYTKRLFE